MSTALETTASPPVPQAPTPPQLPFPATRQSVILDGISWATYERLLAEQASSGTRFIYDRGVLEIMVVSPKHEEINRALALLVEILADEIGMDIRNLGSATFRREDLERGFEPDSSFYIQSAERISGKEELDLTVDPPPDLVIEIDITSPSLNRFPIFAAIGVGEVWRYDGARITIFTLEAGQYVERAERAALPKVTGEALTDLVEASQQLKRRAWLRRVREWAPAQAADAG